jgi:hypothetical protein
MRRVAGISESPTLAVNGTPGPGTLGDSPAVAGLFLLSPSRPTAVLFSSKGAKHLNNSSIAAEDRSE